MSTMNSGPDRLRRVGALLAAPLLLLSVSCDRLSPEDRVRQTIEDAVAAARDGDAEALGEMIWESYSDPMGHGKGQLMALVGFHLCQEEMIAFKIFRQIIFNPFFGFGIVES